MIFLIIFALFSILYIQAVVTPCGNANASSSHEGKFSNI